MVNPLEERFPGLANGGYHLTSPASKKYNCIAWAAGDTENWWWPVSPDVRDAIWPQGVAREESMAAFHDAFATLGYQESASADLEADFEKIALFANDRGEPLHAARQQPNGRWTSKLGELEDIDHDLQDSEGEAYGSVVLVMKRRRPMATHPHDPGAPGE